MSEETPPRSSWSFCGRKIGRASGWDQSDSFAIMVYDFQADPGVPLPDGDISIDYETGLISTYDDQGQPLIVIDFVTVLKALPRDDQLCPNY